jgi:hypothetical protein
MADALSCRPLSSWPRPWLYAALAAAVGGGYLVLAHWFGQDLPSGVAGANGSAGDLDWLGPMLDAGTASASAQDLLVAGANEVYLSGADDHAIVATPKSRGPKRTAAQVDGPIWDMALADGSLWMTATAAADAGRGGVVLKLPIAGGAPIAIADGLGRPRAIACDGKWVFVVDVDVGGSGLLRKSAIVRLPAAAGAGPMAVLGRSEGEVDSVAIDDAHVYWSDRLEGSILVVPKSGGEPRVLASERGLPGQVVVNGDTLFWVEKRSESLWTMPKSGGTPIRIAQDFAGFAHLVVDARGVWWVNEAAVDGAYRVLTLPRSGGEPVAATEPVEAIDALASDGSRLFWARGGEVSAIDAPRDGSR